jgi:hypothetical protein
MNKTETQRLGVIRKTPVVTTSHLEAIGTLEYGLSVHCGVIVVWDEDHDERVLRMIEERFPVGSVKPLAVCEHEGIICILWANEDDATYAAPKDYTTENDWWNPTHYFTKGEIALAMGAGMR